MADLVIPTGYGLWTFELQHAGIQHTALVTLGFKVATPPYTQAQCANALAQFATSMAALHDNEVTYARCIALIGNDGPLIRFEASGTTTGSRAAVTILPPNVSYLLRKTTGFSGRRYRGRMFIPFVAQGGGVVGQNGQLAAGELAALNARGVALLANLVAAGPNASELSLLHAVGLTATPSPTPITTLAGDDFVATQRRRLAR